MGLDSMALKGYEDPDPIYKFVEQYINHDKVFKSAFENKLKSNHSIDELFTLYWHLI